MGTGFSCVTQKFVVTKYRIFNSKHNPPIDSFSQNLHEQCVLYNIVNVNAGDGNALNRTDVWHLVNRLLNIF
jgi:hypothetical protein